MTKLEATAYLKQRFDNLTICMENAKKEGGNIWWLPTMVKSDQYIYHTIGSVKDQRGGRFSSSFNLLKNKLQEILDISQGKSYISWKHKFGMPIHTHK